MKKGMKKYYPAGKTRLDIVIRREQRKIFT
jgi:hypothetical protein